jgi:hypothetical protein
MRGVATAGSRAAVISGNMISVRKLGESQGHGLDVDPMFGEVLSNLGSRARSERGHPSANRSRKVCGSALVSAVGEPNELEDCRSP